MKLLKNNGTPYTSKDYVLLVCIVLAVITIIYLVLPFFRSSPIKETDSTFKEQMQESQRHVQALEDSIVIVSRLLVEKDKRIIALDSVVANQTRVITAEKNKSLQISKNYEKIAPTIRSLSKDSLRSAVLNYKP